MKSDTVRKGTQQAPHRSLFNALGMTKEEMATIGTESMYAVAIPVTRLVAPGPEVARQTPTFPVALA